MLTILRHSIGKMLVDVDEVYEELQAQLHGPESDWTGHHPHHHLLGHAQIIQGEMTNSCQLDGPRPWSDSA